MKLGNGWRGAPHARLKSRRLVGPAIIGLVLSTLVWVAPAYASGVSTLSGTVTDNSSRAVPGATVALYVPGSHTEVASTNTGSDGSYSVSADAATYDVVFTPPSGSGLHTSTFGDYALGAPAVLDAVLSGGSSVTWSGAVVTSEGGAIPFATVALSGPSNYTVGTSNTGGFSLTLAPGTYTVQVLNGVSSTSLPGFDVEGATVTIPGDLNENLTIPVAKVTLTVQDASGSPVAGAPVALTSGYDASNFSLVPGGGQTSSVQVHDLSATTDPTGTATFGLIPAGTGNINLKASPPPADPNLFSGELSNLSITADTALSVTLPPAATWSGSLLTSRGVAIPNASIWMQQGSSSPFLTNTSSTGAFSITVPQGSYGISVSSFGGSGADYPQTFSASGETIALTGNLNANLTIPVAQVAMSVKDPSGTSVGGAAIPYVNGSYYADDVALVSGGTQTTSLIVESLSVTTGSDGVANFAVIPSSSNDITLEAAPPPGVTALAASGLSNLSITSDTSLSVTLPAAVSWTGKLVTSKGVAIPDTAISLNGPWTYSATTASDGAFSLNVEPGTYTLGLTNYAGSGSDYPQAFQLTGSSLTIASDRTDQLTVPVDDVTVTVHDPTGAPVGGASVSYGGNGDYYADNFSLAPGMTQTTAAFVLGLSAGTGTDGNSTFALIPSSTDNVDLEASPPADYPTFNPTDVNGLSVTDDPTDVSVVLQSTDTVPPVIQPVVTPAPNVAGWLNGPVTVSWQCSDSGSGIASCSSPTQETSDGIYPVTGTAEDRAGNISTATQTVRVDRTAPVLTPSLPSPDKNGWYNQDVTVSWSCSDPTVNGASSGVASCPAPTTVSAEGAKQTVSAYGVDDAGNTGYGTATNINIDKTPPNISAPAAPPPGMNTNGWYTQQPILRFSCSDALSGVAYCPAIQVGNGADQTITGVAFDNAGNNASASYSHLNVDTLPPTVSVSLSSSNPESFFGWYRSPTTVTFSCSDTISGIASCPAPQTISRDGASQVVTGTATNNAGLSTTVTATVNLDTTAPTITAAASSAPNSNGWYDQPVTVSFVCSDALSGVSSCSPSTTLASEGAGQAVTGRAFDNAGNQSTATSSPVNIDMTAPGATITTADGSLVAGAAGVDVTGRAADNLSGLQEVDVTFIPLSPGASKATVAATLSCSDATRRSCTWTAAPPLAPGRYDVSAVARDRAGNTAQPTGPVAVVAA